MSYESLATMIERQVVDRIADVYSAATEMGASVAQLQPLWDLYAAAIDAALTTLKGIPA